MARMLIALAAVTSFGIVASMALILIGQRLSGRPAPRWPSAVLVAALAVVPVLAVAEVVAR